MERMDTTTKEWEERMDTTVNKAAKIILKQAISSCDVCAHSGI